MRLAEAQIVTQFISLLLSICQERSAGRARALKVKVFQSELKRSPLDVNILKE